MKLFDGFTGRVVRFAVALLFTASGLIASAQTNCVPVPFGAVGWWRAETNALDQVGRNPGSLVDGATFAAGEVGQGFSLDGVSACVKVPAAASLAVGLGDGLTVETWIQPTDVGNGHSVIEWSQTPGGAPYGTHLWVGHPSHPPGYVFANLADTQGRYHVIDAERVVVAGQLQHLALTYSKTSGLARLLVNGAVVREVNLGTFTPQTSYDLYFGCRPPGDGYHTFYAGIIDEISLYNRALSAAEVQAIYNAGASGKCASEPLVKPAIVLQPTNQTVYVGQNARFSVQASGTAPLSYQWRLNGADLPGATNAVLALTNIQTNQAGNYAVLVSNAVGVVLSSNALLTVNPALALKITSAGGNITLSWPAWATNCVVQQINGDLSSATWTNVRATIGGSNTENTVTLPAGTGAGFYRLYRP